MAPERVTAAISLCQMTTAPCVVAAPYFLVNSFISAILAAFEFASAFVAQPPGLSQDIAGFVNAIAVVAVRVTRTRAFS